MHFVEEDTETNKRDRKNGANNWKLVFFCNQMFECNWWTITCHFFEFVQLKQIKSTQCKFAPGACPGNEARVWTSTSCWARLTALCLSRTLTFSLSLFAGQQEFATNKCHWRRVSACSLETGDLQHFSCLPFGSWRLQLLLTFTAA